MLSDEEKKAIEFIKSELEDEKKARDDYQSLTGLYGNLEIEILLNLIEKQSKEIEELQELSISVRAVNQIDKLEKEIEELKNEVMEKELIIDGMKEDRKIAIEEIQEEYYVSKDKIKAKIEEVDKEEKEALKGTKGQDRYAIKQEYMHKRSVLQSLLEKE